MATTNTIRERYEIPVEDKWAVEDLFPSDEAWAEELATIPADREMSVGRDFNSCDLVVYGNSISRKHCTVTYSSQSNCFLLTDYSSNGTYLSDGTRMQPGAVYALDAGSVVLLASQDYIMEVGVKE